MMESQMFAAQMTITSWRLVFTRPERATDTISGGSRPAASTTFTTTLAARLQQREGLHEPVVV